MACASSAVQPPSSEPGRFTARPQPEPSAALPPPGESPLGLGDRRDGLLYVPRQLRGPLAPLLVLLHGATGSANGVMVRTAAADFAEELGFVVLAPDSREVTWDIVRGVLGPDVAFIDKALQQTFSRVGVDPAHLAIGGFSDGASCALSLGLGNGDLFTHIVAFSPGFITLRRPVGRPAIFVSHGTRDDILPIGTTSRQFVPELEKAGYLVRYREFTGPHTVPQPVAREAFAWMLAPSALHSSSAALPEVVMPEVAMQNDISGRDRCCYPDLPSPGK
jgi:phospholipase/carboxylesterase